MKTGTKETIDRIKQTMKTDGHIHSVPDTLSPGGSFAYAGPSGMDVAPSPALPADPARRLAWLAKHYWDSFNWNDTRWATETSALEGAFMFWAGLLGKMPETDAARLSGALLRKVDFHPDIQLLLLDAAGYFWQHPGSVFRNEELLIPMLEAAIAAPGIGDMYKVHLRARLASVLKNSPGMRATDFTYTTGDDTKGTLHGLRAEYTLLMFYNPGCPECERIEEYILCSEVFASLIASGRLKVLAIYPGKDVEAWRERLPQMPADWTVGHALMEKGGRGAYDLPGIPALYLLDRDQTVLVRNRPVDAIEVWLARHGGQAPRWRLRLPESHGRLFFADYLLPGAQ